MSATKQPTYFKANLNRLHGVNLGDLRVIPGKHLGGARYGLFVASTAKEVTQLKELEKHGVKEIDEKEFDYERGATLQATPLSEVRVVSDSRKTSAITETLGPKALPVTDGPPPVPEVITSDPVEDGSFQAAPIEPPKKQRGR